MNNWQPTEIEQLISQWYVPSSLERKRAILMYFLFWILITINKKEMSTYEWFHLKQALWRRITLIAVIVISLVFLFIAYLNVIPLIVLILLVGVWIFFCYQARNGLYTTDSNKIVFPFFLWIWGRTLDIFDVKINLLDRNIENNDQNSTWNQSA
jgi:ABC-type xylose transport system permease subunit